MENHTTESASSVHLYRVLEDEYIHLYGPLPAEYPWLFLQSHIKDRQKLIEKIRLAQTELTHYLKEKLNAFFVKELERVSQKLATVQDQGSEDDLKAEFVRLKELQKLPDYASSDPDGRELKYALVEVFNQILPDPRFYDPDRFLGVHLEIDTQRALIERENNSGAGEPGTTLICRINRFLLEDAFPDELEVRDLENIEVAHRSYVAAIYSAIHKRERSALCLSGGGIRSATFNLGILQGLARHGLLDKFDYLSTVSGGGYVGSWLSSWIHREADGLETVVKRLSQKPPVMRPEAEPIQHLRNYSNYLSPKLGLLSADTWTLASIVSRNLLLNWLVFIPLLTAMIMLPRLYVSAMTQNDLVSWIPVTLGIAIFFKLMALTYLGLTLPSSGRRNNSQKEFLILGMMPLVLGVGLFTLAWGWANWSGHQWNAPPSTFIPAKLNKGSVIVGSVAMGLYCLFIYTVARLRRRFNPWNRPWWTTLLMAVGAGAIVSIVSAFVGFLFWQFSRWPYLNPGPHPHAFACLAVPILLTLYALAGTLIAGLSSKWTEEDDLEWWARCGAWMLIVVFSWAAVTLLVIFGPTLPARLHWPEKWSDWQSVATAVATAIGVISGAITLLGGFSAGTPAHRKQESAEGVAEATDEKPSMLQKITPFAAPAFLVFIIIVLSLSTNWMLLRFVSFMNWLANIFNWVSQTVAYWLWETRLVVTLRSALEGLPETFRLRLGGDIGWLNHLEIIRFTPFRLVTTVWILLVVFGWIMARAINTNMFSIHSLYGNRLKRAYLGASRLLRRPHTFTGFDSADDLQMHQLRPELFDRESFADLPGLLLKIKQPRPDDMFSTDLGNRLSPETVQMLQDMVDLQNPSEDLQDALIADLNRLLHAGSLYDKQRFPTEKLSEQTKRLLSRPPLGESLVLLNRWLLEDAYKSEIKPRKQPRLLHVVNIALNLVRGDRLAWQERKAETFTVSPLHSGNLWLGYRRSRYYGGEDGISLGTAFTISGAAASPNMGYMISSPLVSFLMAMFNVRLGWWLGNPGRAGDQTYQLAVPKFAFGPIVQEALSLTDDESRYVYLSDGGHFENLGLYEMVLRRCRVIVVSDASTDSDYTYDSLGMAIRKIRIDLGIPIEMPDFGIRPDNSENPYFAIGRINYSCVDDDGTDGILIYIKASLSKAEPRDIMNYWWANRDFPQEEIADQFFTESQFESYRMLGSFIIDRMCESYDGDQDWQANGLSEFVDRLMQPETQRSSDDRFQFARLAPAS